jgi:hypothetical protein
MRRRDFMTIISSLAAWPLGARAQQHAMPVVGVLHGVSAAQWLTAWLVSTRAWVRLAS